MTCDSKPTGSKVIFLLAPAAILAAILDISNCSRISPWYPLDVRYRGPKDVESSEKKTISAGARYTCLATWLTCSLCPVVNYVNNCCTHPTNSWLTLTMWIHSIALSVARNSLGWLWCCSSSWSPVRRRADSVQCLLVVYEDTLQLLLVL